MRASVRACVTNLTSLKVASQERGGLKSWVESSLDNYMPLGMAEEHEEGA